MAPVPRGQTPSLATFLKALKQHDIATAIELFISLLKRRQIRNSRPCALATAQLLLRLVAAERSRDAQSLIKRVREVGARLVAAQPRELAVGNIVRRVLGVIREVVEVVRDEQDASGLSSNVGGGGGAEPGVAQQPSASTSSSLAATSLFGLLQHPAGKSTKAAVSAATQSSVAKPQRKTVDGAGRDKLDIKAEVIDGIKELLDELEIVDTQIAESALTHIFDGDRILTHSSSQTVQKFLTTAARKRKFTVFHAEAYPNDHEATHTAVVNGGKKGTGDDDDPDDRWKPLTAMGINVVVIPDHAAFALMHKMDKVLLAPHSVLADGSLIAASGARNITSAAKHAGVPVVVLSGVYKLSPTAPKDLDALIEYGDPANILPYEDGEFVECVDVLNPLFDWIGPEDVRLYITNIGGYAPASLYRIIEEHYDAEDLELTMTSG